LLLISFPHFTSMSLFSLILTWFYCYSCHD
jgi:hypothetical protein